MLKLFYEIGTLILSPMIRYAFSAPLYLILFQGHTVSLSDGSNEPGKELNAEALRARVESHRNDFK